MSEKDKLKDSLKAYNCIGYRQPPGIFIIEVDTSSFVDLVTQLALRGETPLVFRKVHERLKKVEYFIIHNGMKIYTYVSAGGEEAVTSRQISTCVAPMALWDTPYDQTSIVLRDLDP